MTGIGLKKTGRSTEINREALKQGVASDAGREEGTLLKAGLGQQSQATVIPSRGVFCSLQTPATLTLRLLQCTSQLRGGGGGSRVAWALGSSVLLPQNAQHKLLISNVSNVIIKLQVM